MMIRSENNDSHLRMRHVHKRKKFAIGTELVCRQQQMCEGPVEDNIHAIKCSNDVIFFVVVGV